MLCIERHGKGKRGDHARKSGAADKLMTSPERSASHGKRRPSRSLAPFAADVTVDDREKGGERELNFCDRPAGQPHTNRVELSRSGFIRLRADAVVF